MAFEVAVYTDCAADESISGRTGFQFMAESAGVTPTDEEFIKNGGLHLVPADLSAQDPESHPQTCVYREHAGRLYLGRGRSTGQTLSGRPGNQLTQTIISGAADVLPLRPAQLYSCPQWQLTRVSGQVLEPWQTPLEIDPDFETAMLHEMVVTDPWACELLPEFLTMVELATAGDRTKLIIKHPEQHLVMRWIALASLFVDSAAALQLSFRAFSAHPTADLVAIVGAHPLLSPELTVEVASANNQHLVDLETRTWTRLPVSASAAQHTEWFLGSDPYEAMEALETSDRWRSLMEPGVASAAAALACLPHTGQTEARDQAAAAYALAGLTVAGRADELEAYGEALAEVLVTYAAPADIDLEPAVSALWSLHRTNQLTLTATVVLAVLDWATEPATAARWARLHAATDHHDLRPIEWRDADDRAHAATVLAAILVAAEPEELPALFTLAKALNTGLEADALSEPLERLAQLWSRQPALNAASSAWLHRDLVIDRLQPVLAQALEERDQTAMASLAAGDWDWLIPMPWTFDPYNRLAVWLASRALAKAPAGLRLPLLHDLVASAPTDAWALFLNPVVDPDHRELVLWVTSHRTLDPSLATHLERVVSEDLGGKTSGRIRDLLDALAGTETHGMTPTLRQWVEKHSRLTLLWNDALRAARSSKNQALDELAKVELNWLRLYQPSLAQALLDCTDRKKIIALGKKVDVRVSLEKELGTRLTQADPTALIGALRLLIDGDAGQRKVVHGCLNRLWDSTAPADESVRERLREGLPAGWQPQLAQFERQQPRGKVTRDVSRGARDLFDRRHGD